MSAKKKCCCGSTDPCGCPPGDPWTSGRAASVKLSVVFTGVTSSTPSLGWGSVNYSVGATVRPRWFGVDSISPIVEADCDDDEIPATTEELCAYTLARYNEGSDWTVGGASPPDPIYSDAVGRHASACSFSIIHTETSLGIYAHPTFGTLDSVDYSGTVRVDIEYVEAEDRTYVNIVGFTGADVVVTYDQHQPASSSNCETEEDGTSPLTVNVLVTNPVFAWFVHESDFPGKLCGNASYTFSNQSSDELLPLYTDTCGNGYAGTIRTSTSGSVTISLVDA